MSLTRTRYQFSVDEYEQMIEFGILDENSRVELIRGEVIQKMPVGDRHIGCVNRCNKVFGRAIGDRTILSIQNPIRLGDSEPEPDVSLLKPRPDFYDSGKAHATDVMLVVEVADTSLEYDRDVKGPLYAEAGIVEYWILNLNDDTLEVHRGPRPDGTYADSQVLRRGQQIEIAALPGVTIRIVELL